jgi:phosphoribosylformimino-5-aminoimidazole carboxamide ribotide isomerase
MADIDALLMPECAILAGAITGRALYDGRIDPAEALKRLARNTLARPLPGEG